MACKYNAPNGQPSQLFDALEKSNGLKTAVHNFEMTKTPEFIEWYGDAQVNEVGEPVISNGYFTNETGNVRPLISKLPATTSEKAKEQVKYLRNVFAARGVKINVTADPNAIDRGYVIGTESGVDLVYNPSKVLQDTIFHEFGHIYVDLLGLDHPVVARGVKQLKGSELWNEIAALKPDLNEDQLAKEVLTTAIGMQAARLHNARTKYHREGKNKFLDAIRNFLLWFNQMIRAVADKLGITKDAASLLAYDLTSGKLRSALTGKVSTYKQSQVDFTQNDVVDALSLIEGKVKLHESGQWYTHQDNPDLRLERTTKALDKVLYKFDRDGALRAAATKKTALFKKYNTIKEVERLWADKREEGTGIHGIAETYVQQRQSGRTRSEAKTYILENVYRPENAGQLDEDGVRIYQGMNRDQVEEYIGVIISFLDGLIDKGYKLYPEFVLYSPDHEVAGTIDLLAVRPDGKVEIYDFKTKELVKHRGKEYSQFDKFNKLDYKHETMKGPLSDVPNTMGNKYALQLSTYKMMLEFYGMNVSSMYIVPLVGEIEERDGQYNYKNLKMYDNTSATNFKNGLFELRDLSKRVSSIFNLKEDPTDTIEDHQAYNESEEELRARVDQLVNLEDWIKDVIAELHRSVRAIQDDVDRFTYEDYKVKVQDIIDRMTVDNEFEAIAAYSKYITEEIKNLQGKLFTHIKTNADGTTSPHRGYSTLTWEDIKQLDNENPDEYRRLTSFIVNANKFLEQVVFIQQLPKTVTTEQQTHVDDLLTLVKANESDISDLQAHLDRLRREFNYRYFEISTNPLFKSGDLVEGYEQFFAAQKDENWFQANLDALADTHHPFIANVLKFYNREMDAYMREAKLLRQDWADRSKDMDLTKFVDDETGKVIQEIDWDSYKRERNKMWEEANSKHGKNKKAFGKFVNKWFKENTEEKTPEEVDKMEKKLKKKMGDIQFEEWKNEQFSKYKGIKKKKRSGAYYKPKTSKYTSTAYQALNEEEVEFLNYLRNTLNFLVDHVNQTNIIENGYIPAVPNSNRSDKQKWLSNIGWHDAHKRPLTDDFDAHGNRIHILPFRYMDRLAKLEELEEVPDNATPEVVEEIKKRNDQKYRDRDRAHAARIKKDLSEVMPLFIEEAVKHRHKKNIKFELQRVYDSMLKDQRIIESKGSKLFTDRAKKKANKRFTAKTNRTVDSRILGHYKNWLEQVFYEDFEIDEGQWTKVARVLQNYTSFKNMAFNPYTALNNTVYGAIMSRIEGAGGDFYSSGDWNWSAKEYTGGLISYFSDDYTSTDYGSKQSAIMQEFPIMMDYRELAVNDSDTRYANAAMRGGAWLYSKGYLMQHLSEHMLQNRLLLAMCRSHRIVDGKIINFNEYIRPKIEKTDPYAEDKQKQKDIIAKNKEVRKNAKEAWEKYPTVYDAYEFEPVDTGRGRLKLTKEVDQTELADFKARVLGVNQKLHGIYNREDAGVIQRYALGRLVMQFRKWMRPGFNKRYGARFFDSYWNERRRLQEEGIYATTGKFLFKPFITNFKKWKDPAEGEQVNALRAFGNILKDYSHMIQNAKTHWHSMEDWQKSAIRQTMYEWATFTMATLAASLWLGLKDDDDEEKPFMGYYVVAQQLDRTILEMSTYTPLAVGFGKDKPFIGGGIFNEWNKLLKSPTASTETFERVFMLGVQLLTYPFVDDEVRIYQGGPYRGQSKAAVQFKKLIPLYNQYFKTINLDATYRYYRLF